MFSEGDGGERPADGIPGAGSSGSRHYQMRQQMFAIGDDFWIENERGEKVYKVDGKVLRIRKTLVLEDRAGRPLAQIKHRLLTVRDTWEIEDASGRRMATVTKALITPLRARWSIEVRDGADLEVHGNIMDHEYSIGQGPAKVAEVSKKWFSLRDTYGVEIEPGADEVLILAITICIDAAAHPRR